MVSIIHDRLTWTTWRRHLRSPFITSRRKKSPLRALRTLTLILMNTLDNR